MPSRDPPEPADSFAPTSRRSFLVVAGSAGALGLSAVPASGDRSDGDAVTILASPTQRDVADDAADRLREARPGTRVSVDETTAGPERFATGAAEVLIGSRPMLPDERSRAAEHDVEPFGEELPTATATLHRPESSWLDCLRPRNVAEAWESAGAVETWAEVTSDGGRGAVAPDGVERHLPHQRGGQFDAEAIGDGSALVRGVRAVQYASGRGGLGYYEPDPSWIGASADASGDATGSGTPLVRLASLQVDRSTLQRAVVDDVHRALAGVSADRVGNVPYFADPYEVVGNG